MSRFLYPSGEVSLLLTPVMPGMGMVTNTKLHLKSDHHSLKKSHIGQDRINEDADLKQQINALIFLKGHSEVSLFPNSVLCLCYCFFG